MEWAKGQRAGQMTRQENVSAGRESDNLRVFTIFLQMRELRPRKKRVAQIHKTGTGSSGL